LLTLAELKPKVAIGGVRLQQKLIQVVLSVLIPTETNRDIGQATSRVVIARFLLQELAKNRLRFVKATLIEEKPTEPRHCMRVVWLKEAISAQKSDCVLCIAVALVSIRLAQKGARLTLDLKGVKPVNGGATKDDCYHQNEDQPDIQSMHFPKNSPQPAYAAVRPDSFDPTALFADCNGPARSLVAKTVAEEAESRSSAMMLRHKQRKAAFEPNASETCLSKYPSLPRTWRFRRRRMLTSPRDMSPMVYW
jgi:hypothetical protein